MNKKQTIRLNESQLRRIVKESVGRILKEYGESPNSQRALGALQARKVLRTNGDTEDEFFANQEKNSNSIYRQAEVRRSHLGDDFDDLGNVKNPLYKHFCDGYTEYFNSHPDERMGYDERLRKLRKF